MQSSICRRAVSLIPGLTFALFITLALALGGCAHDQGLNVMASSGDDDDVNVRPANYKSDILGAMHAYLNDPTGIRDAGISEPALKSFNASKRYVVCVRYNARKSRTEYIGDKEVAAVFRRRPLRPLRRDRARHGKRPVRGRDLCAVSRT